MGFSPKRMKMVAEGKVEYLVLQGDTVLFRGKNAIDAVQALDKFQKANPGIEYSMKIEVIE